MAPNLITAWVFAALFGIASIVNVVAGFLEAEKLRKISKPFCLLFLSIAAILAVPTSPLVYLGALFGFVGDVILIFKDNKICVGAGALSFLIGHCCYIAEVLVIVYGSGVLDAYPYAWAWMLLYCALMVAAMAYPMYRLTNHSKPFTILGAFYSTILITDGVSALMGCCLGQANYLFLMIIGCAFFIASDSTLTFTIFIHDIKRRDFYIMLTYLLGQAAIVGGLIFTLLK